jgi:lysophospholipase L1-like esterase
MSDARSDAATADKPSSLRRRRLFRLAAVAIALLLALLLAEGVLRVYVAARGWTPNCYAGSVQLLVPDATNGYTLAKGFHLRSGVYEITTNDLGLRGPQLDKTKPAGTTRIAILGGSSAFGYLVSDGQEAARLLEQKLTAAGRDVEVLGAGVPGYNLFQTTHRYREVIAPLQPDVVVLYLGWNDLTYLVSDEPTAERHRVGHPYASWERVLSHSTLYGLIAYRLLSPPARFVPPPATRSDPTEAGAAQFRENLRTLLAEIEASGAQPVIVAQVMAADARATDDVRSYLGATPQQQQQNAALGQWVQQTLADIATQQQVPFVDASTVIAPTSEHLADAIHLTPAGEQKLAELFTEQVNEGLNR